jgi:phosphoribosyl 1,2-cyclic phosphate phosphodiesterase
MKLVFLGTGAAEGNPSAYCGCPSCRAVRGSDPLSRDRRTRSSLRVGERVQIDFGPDGWAQSLLRGVSLRSLEHVLVTHSHADHFDLSEIMSKGMARDANPAPLSLHVSEGLAGWLARNERVLLEWFDVSDAQAAEIRTRFPVHPMSPFRSYEVGELRVEPVLGTHQTLRGAETALSYLMELPGGARVLYACDTGWFGDRTWEYLRGRHADVLIMEATFGGRTDRPEHPHGHLDCRSHALMLEEMARIGFVDSSTRLYATHLNPHQGLDHEGLQRWFDSRGLGVRVAYDGLEVDA